MNSNNLLNIAVDVEDAQAFDKALAISAGIQVISASYPGVKHFDDFYFDHVHVQITYAEPIHLYYLGHMMGHLSNMYRMKREKNHQ